VDKLKKRVTFFLLPWLLSGCFGTRYLQENQKLLFRQTIQAPKGFNKEGLSDLYVQKANHSVLNLKLWMYHYGETRYVQQNFIDKKIKAEEKFNKKISATKNQKKINSFQFRKQKKIDALNKKIENGNLPMQWGEKVPVYDSVNVAATQEKMTDFLFNNGYFQNKVVYEINESKQRVGVTYVIDPGRAYFYDTIFYLVPDKTVEAIMVSDKNKSLIKKGDRYNQNKLNKERERIDLMLKDVGYYDFTRQYVEFAVDTAFQEPFKIALQIEIKNPPRRDSHKVFHVDSITFTTDAAINKVDTLDRKSEPKFEITFNYFKRVYSRRILAQRVFLKKDSLYSRSETFATQRQLANLDIFKFINMNFDSSGGKFIANIFCSPLDKYSWSNEAGLTVTQGFPGPYVSTS